MPDITMCKGEGEFDACPKLTTCYRHVAKPDERQTYFALAPFDKDGGCQYFYPDSQLVQIRTKF